MLSEAYEDAANRIEAIAAGTAGVYGFDDYTSIREDNPYLESVRQRCLKVCDLYPPAKKGSLFNPEGNKYLAALAQEVRQKLRDELVEKRD